MKQFYRFIHQSESGSVVIIVHHLSSAPPDAPSLPWTWTRPPHGISFAVQVIVVAVLHVILILHIPQHPAGHDHDGDGAVRDAAAAAAASPTATAAEATATAKSGKH